MKRSKDLLTIHKKTLMKFTMIVFLFSTSCLRNDNSLQMLMISGVFVIMMALLLALSCGMYLHHLTNNRVIIWLFFLYGMYELYGLTNLRLGTFNWDLYLFNFIELIALALMLDRIGNKEEILEVVIVSCKFSIIISTIYMYSMGALNFDFNNITFGERIGDYLTGNVNTTAINFGIMSFPVFYSLICKNRKDITGYIVCLISAVVMLFTGSKKSLLIFMVVFFLWVKEYKKPVKFIAIPLVLCVSVYLIFNVPAFYNTIGYRIEDALATFGIGEAVSQYQSTEIRKEFISLGLKSFLKVPIFGGGINYFQYINNVYSYSHNNYIEMLNSFGIIGFSLFYIPIICVLRNCIKLYKNNLISNNESIYLFLLLYIILQLLLDVGLVSYTGSGITYFAYFLPFVCLNTEKVNEVKQNDENDGILSENIINI